MEFDIFSESYCSKVPISKIQKFLSNEFNAINFGIGYGEKSASIEFNIDNPDIVVLPTYTFWERLNIFNKKENKYIKGIVPTNKKILNSLIEYFKYNEFLDITLSKNYFSFKILTEEELNIKNKVKKINQKIDNFY